MISSSNRGLWRPRARGAEVVQIENAKTGGDMSRGSVLLRAVREDSELEYSTLDVPRHKPRHRKRDG